MKVELSLKLN
jgi:hypothetical protein